MKRSFITYIITALTAATTNLCIAADTIIIANQAQMQSLPINLETAIASGAKDINIIFKQAQYFYTNNLINISKKQAAGVNININGNGATLIAAGIQLHNGQKYNRNFSPYSTYITDTHNTLSQWGQLHSVQSEVEIIDEKSASCRLKYDDAPDLNPEECRDVWINLTEWFKSSLYKVEKIDNGWIYFTATGLNYNKSVKTYNVNADKGYGGLMPRFRLCNAAIGSEELLRIEQNKVHLPETNSTAYECTATRFLTISRTQIGTLSISNLQFLGNQESTDYLITFNNVKADSIIINNCTFTGLGSGAIYNEASNRLRVNRCSFIDCRRNGVYSRASQDARIEYNTFHSMGHAMLNSFAIRCDGSEYLVAHNTISDFGYGAIAIGTWWAADKRMPNTGVVECNEIFYTPSYMQDILQHSLMDSGAIYLYTQSDDAHVRYNFIHDYTGAYDNRGIFCDDGANNFQIYGNIILNTPNSFSIDSRRAVGIETKSNTFVKKTNINNHIYDNIIDGSIRFEGRDNNANCTLGSNIFLSLNGKAQQKNITAFLQRETKFTISNYNGIDNRHISLTPDARKQISRAKSYKHIEKYLQ